MKSRVSSIFVIFLLSIFIFPKFTSAVDSGPKLTIYSVPINLTTTPGSTVSAQLKVRNSGEQEETIHVSLYKFSAYGESGMPRIENRGPGDDYFDWVTFSENDFKIIPNEWKVITATIDVPTTAAFGYYYAVAFSRKEEDSNTAKTGSKLTAAVTNLILLDVKSPNAVLKVDVKSFGADKKIYEFLPARFSVKLSNEGNVHIAPRGNIFISNKKNKNIGYIEINENIYNVLPGTNRVFDSSWSDGTPVFTVRKKGEDVILKKDGKPKMFLNIDSIKLNKIRFGKYDATMILVYDDGQRDVPIQATTSFWVIPWRLMIAFVGVVALMLAGIWMVMSKVFLKFKKK